MNKDAAFDPGAMPILCCGCRFGLDPDSVLDNVAYAQAHTCEAQVHQLSRHHLRLTWIIKSYL